LGRWLEVADGSSDESVGDHDIVQLVVAGDRAGFEVLFNRYAQLVFRVSMRMLESRADAEDALSATYLQAWAIRDRATLVEGSLRPWLLAIAVNIARNDRRSRRRREAAWLRLSVVPDALTTPGMSPENQVVDHMSAYRDAVIVSAGIADLPEAERLVVQMCLLEGLSSAQAAAVLQIPDGTVRSRLARARGRLRRLLQTTDGREHEPGSGHLMSERRNLAAPAVPGQIGKPR
jgi:RNA polymerase sigma factor (sigma-70 family)